MTLLFLALWLQMSAPPQVYPGATYQMTQRAADETDGKPRSGNGGNKYMGAFDGEDDPPKTYACTDHPEYFPQVPLCHPSEPVDVPAVQEISPPYPPCSYVNKNGWCQDGNGGYDDPVLHLLITTCADKSRILEHDENSPPKYWCRKVQP